MKVKDFINELEKLPQDAELFAKDEFGWFYPADIIEEDKVCVNSYSIIGSNRVVERKWKSELKNEH